MRGNATLERMNSEIPNTTSVQIISPIFGLTRKLPLLVRGGEDGVASSIA